MRRLGVALKPGHNFGLKLIDQGVSEGERAELRVLQQWHQIERENELACLVAGMGIGEGRIRSSSSDDGVVVVLPASDLREEDVIECLGKFGIGGDVEGDLVFIRNPIKVAPDFAAEELFGMLFLGQGTKRREGGSEDPEVAGVLVGRAVGVDRGRAGELDDVGELCGQGDVYWIFDPGGGMTELILSAILASVSSVDLFLVANFPHLLITVFCEGAGAGGPSAVGAGHPCKPLLGAVVAGGNSVESHELEIVLVSADAEVSGAGQGLGESRLVGNVRSHHSGEGSALRWNHRKRSGGDGLAVALVGLVGGV